jgi:opacity protein-like surface antigen
MRSLMILASCAFSILLTSIPPVRAETLGSGFYLGVHGGFGTAGVDGVFDAGEGDREDRVEGGFNLDRGVGGVMLGYNHAVGRWVLGIEGDMSFMDWSQTISDTDIEDSLAETDRATAEIDWLASIRARAGFMAGSALIYATAGVAFAGAEWTACNCDIGAADIGRLDLDATGFIVGGGLEADLGGSWSLRAEGLYATFGDDHAATSLNADSDEDDFAALDDLWIARAGIVYRFSR